MKKNISIKEKYSITLENIIKDYYIDSVITRTYKERCNTLTDSLNSKDFDSSRME
jgi:hypothetical protein